MEDYTYRGVQRGCRRPTDDEWQQIEEAIYNYEPRNPQTGAVHIDDVRRSSVIDAVADGTFEAPDGVFDFRMAIGPSAGLEFWGAEGTMPVHVEREPTPLQVLVPEEWSHFSWWLCRNAFADVKAEIKKLLSEAAYDEYFQPGTGKISRQKAAAAARRVSGRLGTVEEWERAAKLGYDGSGTLDDARRKDKAAEAERLALKAVFVEGVTCR